jgi:uncharacterized protein (DUF1015 family)
MSPAMSGGTAAGPALCEPSGVTMRPPRMMLAGRLMAGRLADAADSMQDESAQVPFERLQEDAAQLRQAVRGDEGTVEVGDGPVVYRLQAGGHQQTGVVMEVSLADYRRGRVRRHEATRPQRQQRLARSRAASGLELVPVTLLHRPRPRLHDLLRQATARPPQARVDSGDGVTESVWVPPTGALTRAVLSELDAVDVLYIADGHHRMAAAAEHAAERHRGGAETASDPSDPSDYVLCALFPADQTRVFGYHRRLPRPPGVAAADLVEALAAQPATQRVAPCEDGEPQPGPGVVAMWLDGRWYDVVLSPREATPAHAALDVVALEEGVLAPALQALGVPPEQGVAALAGADGPGTVADWCADHDAVGFVLHPPTVEEIMAVSDAGQVMPPKSTWFDPKARPGLFLRELSGLG